MCVVRTITQQSQWNLFAMVLLSTIHRTLYSHSTHIRLYSTIFTIACTVLLVDSKTASVLVSVRAPTIQPRLSVHYAAYYHSRTIIVALLCVCVGYRIMFEPHTLQTESEKRTKLLLRLCVGFIRYTHHCKREPFRPFVHSACTLLYTLVHATMRPMCVLAMIEPLLQLRACVCVDHSTQFRESVLVDGHRLRC